MMSDSPVLVWLRQDLRIADQPTLRAAIDTQRPVIPVYIYCQEEEHPWKWGGASRWWLHHSLESLANSLEEIGSRLILRQGKSQKVLEELISETGADCVFWSRRYEPHIIPRDKEIKAALKEQGVHAESFNANLLFEPWAIQNKQGKPYQVFTQFWKTCLDQGITKETVATPRKCPPPQHWPKSALLDEFALLPKQKWADRFSEFWMPGEQGAHDYLGRFVKESLEAYRENRNRPDLIGTSRLSPHLHFGEISPRQIWNAIQNASMEGNTLEESRSTYLAEIGWREFSHHLLYHFPETPTKPLREKFTNFPWSRSKKHLKAWQRGLTGYPIVDAGMRELWKTGWMHNRVRMIVASFLTKDLLIPWQQGAKWFWDTLLDADLGNNTLGWQWTAGCGADAAPYFRVFNPIGQGKKFDPQGEYVRQWVPEIARLPDCWIHQPWEAPQHELVGAGIELGGSYPMPIVDHTDARIAALEAWNSLKG